MWYNSLAEDLVGEDETVECPECDKTLSDFKGMDGFLAHVKSVHKIDDPYCESQEGFLTEHQIHEEIASETSYGVDTVRRLVKIGSLPDE